MAVVWGMLVNLASRRGKAVGRGVLMVRGFLLVTGLLVVFGWSAGRLPLFPGDLLALLIVVVLQHCSRIYAGWHNQISPSWRCSHTVGSTAGDRLRWWPQHRTSLWHVPFGCKQRVATPHTHTYILCLFYLLPYVDTYSSWKSEAVFCLTRGGLGTRHACGEGLMMQSGASLLHSAQRNLVACI